MNSEQKHQESRTLEDLFKPAEKVEDTELAEVLFGKLSLTKEKDHVFLENDFAKRASINDRLIAVGLARHVLHRKGIIPEEDLAKPAEWYSREIQENPRTVLEQLSRLKAQRIFERTNKGYQIPLWAVKRAIEYLEGRKRKVSPSVKTS